MVILIKDEVICPTKLLSDSPTNKDEFRLPDEDILGPHERTAKALYRQINSERGGKSVALTGTWGSGKSSVVNMLDDELKSNKEILFTFNAWSHEGDPLRRSFLEELIDFLVGKGWLEKSDEVKKGKDLEEVTKQLSGKYREEEEKKKPLLSTFGKLFGVLALFLPIGAVVIPSLVSLAPPFTPRLRLYLAMTGVLASSSILLIFFVGILRGVKWALKSIGKKLDQEWPEDLIEMVGLNKLPQNFDFLTKETTEKTHKEMFERPEPTSVEFQYTFKKLLQKAFEGSEDKKLIVVMDNIDRIDPRKTLDIWSTMRSFFDFPNEEWVEQLWLIVPFDKKSIKELWNARKTEKQSAKLELSAIGEDEDSEDGKKLESNKLQNNETSVEFTGIRKEESVELGNAFLNKTFQMSFHVPPPLLSNWKDFFIKKLGEALKDHPKKDFNEIYKIFSIKRKKPEIPPTPRQIKIFINQIGTLHREWQHKIPLKHMALYVALENQGWEPERELAENDVLDDDDRVRNFLGGNWKEDLAALHLKLHPDKAIEILLGNRIDKAVSEQDSEFIQNHIDSLRFRNVLVDYLDEEFIERVEEPSLVANFALRLKEGVDREGTTWDDIWSRLAESLKAIDRWNVINEKIGKGISIILKSRMKKEDWTAYLPNSLSSVSNSLNNVEENNEDKLKNWIKGTLHILELCVDEEIASERCRSGFRVTSSASKYIQIANLIEKNIDKEKSHRDKLISFYQPEIGSEEIVEKLSETVSQHDFGEPEYQSLRVLKSTPLSVDWSSLTEAVQNIFQNQDENFNSNEIYYLVRTLLKLRPKEDKLQVLAENGQLAHHLQQNAKNKDAGIIIFSISYYQPGLGFNDDWGQAQNGRQFLEKVLGNPGNYKNILDTFISMQFEFGSFEKLVKFGKETEDLFLESVLKEIISRGKVDQLIQGNEDVKTFIKYFDYLYKAIEEEMVVNLIKGVGNIDVIRDELIEKPLKVQNAKLNQIILEESSSEKFEQRLKRKIKNLESKTWAEQLEENGNIINLALKVEISEEPKHLSSGIQQFTRSLIYKDCNQLISGKEFRNILDWLDEGTRTSTLKGIIDDIINGERGEEEISITEVIKLYNSFLIDWKVMEHNFEELTRTIFLQKILESLDEVGVRWMRKIWVENKEDIDYNIDSIRLFKTKVNNALEDDIPERVKNDLQKIQSIFPKDSENPKDFQQNDNEPS